MGCTSSKSTGNVDATQRPISKLAVINKRDIEEIPLLKNIEMMNIKEKNFQPTEGK